jgi:histidinol-phosphate aminotransferase
MRGAPLQDAAGGADTGFPATAPTPSPAVEGLVPYRVPRPRVTGQVLRLDANEGPAAGADLLEGLADLGTESLRRYPGPGELEALLAERLGIETDRLLVTGGSNDALDRACRAVLAPGRRLVLPIPTFEMIPRYARLAGAEVIEVPWPEGPLPVEEIVRSSAGAAAVAVVTPNNPTGAAARPGELTRLAEALPQALLIVDLAYAEFADHDLSAESLALPWAVSIRTLSKAWGLAGARVGYAVARPEVIGWLRAAGQNYPVSEVSRLLALRRLRTGEAEMAASSDRIRTERRRLFELLEQGGADPLPSQANFVLARFTDAAAVQQALADRGILVRAFPGRPGLDDALRITCPGHPESFARLSAALKEVLS